MSEEGHGDDDERVQTCARSALLAVRRKESTRLPDGKVSTPDGDLDLGSLRDDEAE
jgi:hypothetical protein